MWWIGTLICWSIAIWMTLGFVEECRKADGFPWAGEVPMALIAMMVLMGAACLIPLLAQA